MLREVDLSEAKYIRQTFHRYKMAEGFDPDTAGAIRVTVRIR